MRAFVVRVALTSLWLIAATAVTRAQAQTQTAPAPTPTPVTQAMPSASPAATPPPHETIARLSADHIAFYYDRFLVEADGNVRVQTSDGFSVTGQSFSMDLKLNRFLVAGNVHLNYRGQTAGGAAVADFLDFNRLYFVPVTTEPDRWTFLNGDLAHPVKGRIMPGDTFEFPDVGGTPSFTATSAVIGTHQYIRLQGATAMIGGAGVPLGSYVINFSPNPYFAQNSLSGANFDVTWNFAGNTNSLSAIHLRQDQYNGLYAAFEQHLVGSHEYAIFSLNPLTKAGKWFNLQLYDKLGSRFQIQTFTQYYEYQRGFVPPYAAQQTTYINAIQAFNRSYLQASANFTNYNLLGVASLYPKNNYAFAGNLSHPSSAQFTWTSFQNKVFDLPLYEQTYFSWGFNHDTVGATQYLTSNILVPGLQVFGPPCVPQPPAAQAIYYCPVYTTITNSIVGFNLFTPSIKFGDQTNPYHTFYLNASLNDQRQWHSLPHHINSQTTTVSLSRTFDHSVSSYVSYQVQNTGDYYKFGGYIGCVTPTPSPGGPQPTPCPPSLTSFTGASTLRTVNVDVNFAPNPEFNASILYRHHDDFPVPAPNVFPNPPNNVIGQPLYTSFLGQPPNDITPNVRFKLLPHMLIDISRTYYFHFGSEGWATQPNFIVQILPFQG